MSENQITKLFNGEKTVYELYILTATENKMNLVDLQVAN